jgi:hypothetical protein
MAFSTNVTYSQMLCTHDVVTRESLVGRFSGKERAVISLRKALVQRES